LAGEAYTIQGCPKAQHMRGDGSGGQVQAQDDEGEQGG